MKTLEDKSVDLFLCDLPYGETNCKWDTIIDMEEFWTQFKRVRKSKKTACIHFCSTKFGYTLIKSWEKGFKMDMVWKKRNKTGGLQSRHRPMRNHEMVYFFYEQAPKYNRDKYHKRIKGKKPHDVESDEGVYGTNSGKMKNTMHHCFDPPNPASVVEAKDEFGWDKSVVKEMGNGTKYNGANFEPPNPVSVVEEDEPKSMFESKKVFIGKRNHQTEKPLDILEFFLKYYTDEGDTVLDPTMGSGSTGVACKKLNRNFIGFELDKKIFDVAVRRCSE
jgi:site-specific DNA-methyltransferase (adenine-specific)